jgi:hypothetical protein
LLMSRARAGLGSITGQRGAGVCGPPLAARGVAGRGA